jgi:hypothetical protein
MASPLMSVAGASGNGAAEAYIVSLWRVEMTRVIREIGRDRCTVSKVMGSMPHDAAWTKLD